MNVRLRENRNRIADPRRLLAWSVMLLIWIVTALHWVVPGAALAQNSAPQVDVATLNGTIDVFAQGYIERVLGVAQSDHAQALILQLDTPGGSVDATYAIAEDFFASSVPVVVYVAPSGARAASGGTFVTYAANIAAMAPGTNIGAAHPVGSGGEDITGTEGVKVLNDAVAHIRNYAEQRGRNADWAAQAVSESVSITANQALSLHVIDLIANDLNDLLDKLDGRQVTVQGHPVTLHTRGATIRMLDMNFFEEFFSVLLDPNIALILLNIGSLAILLELYSPGATLPATVGVICLTLAAVALFNLPTNWAAVILILASIVMFVFDLKVNSLVLTAGGILAFILGAFFLFRPFTPPEPTAPEVSVSPFVIAGLSLVTASFFLVVLAAVVRSHRVPVVTGTAPLLGATGTSISDLRPEGQVRVRSEEWTAVADKGMIPKGAQVRVTAVEGLKLHVTRVE